MQRRVKQELYQGKGGEGLPMRDGTTMASTYSCPLFLLLPSAVCFRIVRHSACARVG